MIFTSIEFIIFFFITFFVYNFIPQKYRIYFLLLMSYFFYACWKLEYLFLLILPTIFIYFISIKINTVKSTSLRKFSFILGLISGLCALLLFKYTDFIGSTIFALTGIFVKNLKYTPANFILPIGISFYTFKLISYLIDVYYDKIKPERHPGYLFLYVSFFPQLLAGPIDRAVNFIPELKKKVAFDYDRVTNGLKLVVWGFFKKLVIADRLAIFVDQVYNDINHYKGFSLIIATIFYAFQIYCDFSGYSDIAIGLSKMFGFKSMKNFDSPYISQNVIQFWNKWHISLSTWLRDYLFLPMAYATMRRIKTPKLLKIKVESWGYILGIFVTMFLGGLWHGAKWTFVLWGAIHGIYLIISFITKKIRKRIIKKTKLNKFPKSHHLIKIFLTFSLISFAWIFFRANTVDDAFYLVKNLWQINEQSQSIYTNYNLHEFFLSTSLILFIYIIDIIGVEKIAFKLNRCNIFWRWTCYYMLIFSIIILGKYNIQEFIYFNF